jgi:hypothetical protein
MTKRNEPSTQGKATSSPDKLVKTGEKGSVELSADELEKVSGGSGTSGGGSGAGKIKPLGT